MAQTQQAGGSLRARKKARTRERIAQAALELFAAQGFDATTVDEIADAADVSRRTFFRYFETKEAAFFSENQARFGRFQAILSAPEPGESAWETVQRACVAMAEAYMAHRDVALVQHRIIEASRNLKAYDQVLDAQWEDALGAALAREGSGLDRRMARLFGGALIGMVRAGLRDWFEGDAQDDLVALARMVFARVRLEGPVLVWGAPPAGGSRQHNEQREQEQSDG